MLRDCFSLFLFCSGLEAHSVSIKLVSDELYAENPVQSFTLPSTLSQLSKKCRDTIVSLFDIRVKKEKNVSISNLMTDLI